MKRIRTLVVDDQNVVRDGIVMMLRVQPDIHVVGEALDGLQAVITAKKTKPDVVLLDLQMPKQDGLSTIPKIRDMLPGCHILVLTGYAENDRVYQAIKAGAVGYLLKDATRVQLIQAIRDAAEGKPTIPPSIAVKVIQEIDHPAHAQRTAAPLSRRELETLQAIARGLSNAEIAKEMGVHPRTIAKYVGGILDKLQLASRTQAALYALREGLTEPRDKK